MCCGEIGGWKGGGRGGKGGGGVMMLRGGE